MLLFLVLALIASDMPGDDTLEGQRHLRLCASGAGGDPAAECRKALVAGLGPSSAARAHTLLGLFVEPAAPELQRFDRQRQAEESYERALAAWPDSALAAYRLGILLSWRGQNSDALRWLDHAASLRPDWAGVHAARSEALRGLKRDDEAVSALEAAARADVTVAAEMLVSAGDLENARGRSAEATRLYLRAAAARPEDPWVCANLGANLANSHENAEATAVLLAGYTNRAGADGETLAALSSWLRVVGRDDEALQAARDAAVVLPDSPHVLRELGSSLRRKKRLQEALATYRHWCRVAPDDDVALVDYGQTLEESGRIGAAIGVYRAYYRRKPQWRGDAALRLGSALVRAGRCEEAIPVLKEASGWPDPRRLLALTLRKCGRIEEAAALDQELAKAEQSREPGDKR
jgi:tetratricopeptide (TPR) repeat protein